jgi:hypothetical protein
MRSGRNVTRRPESTSFQKPARGRRERLEADPASVSAAVNKVAEAMAGLDGVIDASSVKDSF